MPNAVTAFCKRGLQSVKEEMLNTWAGIRSTEFNLGFLFAVFCVFLVIVGNVMLLIALNFWLVQFPAEEAAHNSMQIAVQVVPLCFLFFLFLVLSAVFSFFYGGMPLWRALTDTNRIGNVWYRVFLLFASGASNGLSSVLAVYAMTYTPEFIQAVLLCAIPFSAQAWTVIFIAAERKRNYLSLFLIFSFLLFVAGVLLSSLSAFLNPDSTGEKASWAWALLYLASTVLFGLWCVVQRLYLDAMVVKPTEGGEAAGKTKTAGTGAAGPAVESSINAHQREELEGGSAGTDASRGDRKVASNSGAAVAEDEGRFSDMDEDDEGLLSPSADMMMKRQWGSQEVEDNAAKLVLLVGGVLFQLLVTFVVFPVDAIPWFGTSSTALEAWYGFRNSMDFIFSSWFHIRHGLLYTLGFAMSFVGCTYLNEHSPTLASVVLQLAGPITSLVIIIIPQWNVYQDSSSVGQKVGGVILLLAAALLYHFWEQQSMRVLQAKAEEAQRRRERAMVATAPDASAGADDVVVEQRELKLRSRATREPTSEQDQRRTA